MGRSVTLLSMLWALLLLPSLAAVGVLGLAWRVHRYGRQDQARPCDVIVVLGARVLPGGHPSGALRARIEKAAALMQGGLGQWLLLSGGAGEHTPSEAQVMLRLAAALDVPASACWMEEQSHSTEQNARHCAELLRRRGARYVVVVSDGYHLFRARQCFRFHGWEVTTSPASLAGRRWTARAQAYRAVREALALCFRPRLLFARRPRADNGDTRPPGRPPAAR